MREEGKQVVYYYLKTLHIRPRYMYRMKLYGLILYTLCEIDKILMFFKQQFNMNTTNIIFYVN